MPLTKNNKRLGMAGPLLTIFCIGMLFSLTNTLLPTIQKDLASTLVELQWIMNGLGIFLCSSLVIMGQLSDRYGKKKLFVLASIGIAICFTGIALAKNTLTVICFQAISGLCISTFLLTTQSFILHYYTDKEASKGLAIWTGVVAIGLGLGPIVSGIFSHFLSWRLIYVTLTILILAGMVLTIRYSPSLSSLDKHKKLDTLGAIFLVGLIASLVFLIVQLKFITQSTLVSLVIFIIIMATSLYFVERKSTNPILIFSLFKTKSFLVGSITNGFAVFYLWAAFFLFPYYLQNILHTSSFTAGLIMLCVSIPLAGMSFVIGRLFKQLGPRILLIFGFFLMALAAFSQADTTFLSISNFIISCFLFGFGWGFTWSVSLTTALRTIPEAAVGTSIGTFLTFQETGGTLGLAIVGSVARSQPSFITGYHKAMWVLVITSLVSVALSAILKKSD